MTIHLSSQSDLEDAVHALVKQDVRLKPIFELTGMPALRQREPGFAGLAAIVCGQQLSTASAGAIWGRLTAAFDPFDHEVIRKARADRLVLPRSWRCLAGRRYRDTRRGQGRTRPQDPPDRQADGAAGGAVATVARRGCASVVELLPRVEKA